MTSLNQLIQILTEQKKTIAAAESCSGGYLSYLLTSLPGSSSIFKGSSVVYSLESKTALFGLKQDLLQETQGVSSQVCLELAQGARKLFASDIGVSIVGFAGPSAKPGIEVGTVYIGVSTKEKTLARKIVFDGSRGKIQKKSCDALIKLTLSILENRNAS